MLFYEKMKFNVFIPEPGKYIYAVMQTYYAFAFDFKLLFNIKLLLKRPAQSVWIRSKKRKESNSFDLKLCYGKLLIATPRSPSLALLLIPNNAKS